MRWLLLLLVVVLASLARAADDDDIIVAPTTNDEENVENDNYREADFSNDDVEGHESDGDGDRFLPKNMLSLELPNINDDNSSNDDDDEEAGSMARCFYQRVDVAPASIRGAWFVSTAGTATVHVTVKYQKPRAPPPLKGQRHRRRRGDLLQRGKASRNLLKDDNEDEEEDEEAVGAATTLLDEEIDDQDRGSINLDALRPGVYAFCFENSFPDEQDSKILTFSVDITPSRTTAAVKTGGAGGGEAAKAEHIQHITDTTRDLESTLESLQTELEVVLLRFSAQAASQDSAEHRVSWYTAVESVVILCITLGQVYFVRRLVDGGGGAARLGGRV